VSAPGCRFVVWSWTSLVPPRVVGKAAAAAEPLAWRQTSALRLLQAPQRDRTAISSLKVVAVGSGRPYAVEHSSSDAPCLRFQIFVSQYGRGIYHDMSSKVVAAVVPLRAPRSAAFWHCAVLRLDAMCRNILALCSGAICRVVCLGKVPVVGSVPAHVASSASCALHVPPRVRVSACVGAFAMHLLRFSGYGYLAASTINTCSYRLRVLYLPGYRSGSELRTSCTSTRRERTTKLLYVRTVPGATEASKQQQHLNLACIPWFSQLTRVQHQQQQSG